MLSELQLRILFVFSLFPGDRDSLSLFAETRIQAWATTSNIFETRKLSIVKEGHRLKWFKAFVALVEDEGSVPSIHMAAHNHL